MTRPAITMMTATIPGFEPCSRCGGSGTIHGYAHVQGGVCFRCGGAGYLRVVGRKHVVATNAEVLAAYRATNHATDDVADEPRLGIDDLIALLG